MESKKIVFVVPCYNETLPLTKTIKSLLKYGEVVLVNDGSKNVLNLAPDLYKEINYLHHVVNRGQGAALETGFEFIRLYFPAASYIITFDADGQHSLRDALKMVSKAQQGYDVVLGSRFILKNNEMNRFKAIVLQSFAKSYSFFSGSKITDRHFGLRVFSRRFIEENTLKTSNFEHADEILNLVVKNNWKFCEFPCTVLYTEYSMNKGQPIINGINILFDRATKKI